MKKMAGIIMLCLVWSLCVGDSPESTATVDRVTGDADKILVVHFHRVHQCTCCINVGKWSEETILKYFPEEHEAGTIVYMDVCVEENMEMANKYNAYGASLYFNIVNDGNDNIIEMLEVWQHCHDHDTFVKVLRTLLEDALEQD